MYAERLSYARGREVMATLSPNQKSLLRLVVKGAGPDGWGPVSEMLCKVVSETIPSDLVEFEKLVDGGRIRLTERGKVIVDYI
jgi:hypothetical protein